MIMKVRRSDLDCSHILCSGKEGLRSIAPNICCPVTGPLVAARTAHVGSVKLQSRILFAN